MISVPTSLARYGSRRLAINRSASHSSEQGVTLLECLMAIVVTTLTVAMITPPLFIATATRVQNRRAEQALQIAQGEIDRLQVLMAQGENRPERLPAIGSWGSGSPFPPPTGAAGLLKSVNSTCPAPSNDQQIATNLALPVDVDGDCQADFYMQVFRDAGRIPTAESRPGALRRTTEFRVGVRVYSFLVKDNWAQLQPGQASLQLTSGQGSQRTRALAELFTKMTWSDKSFNLCEVQKASGRACN